MGDNLKVGMIGVSHKNASLDIRQRLTFTKTRKAQFTEALSCLGVSEFMLLSTCNRTEIYYTYFGKDDVKNIVSDYICDKFGEDMEYYLYHLTDKNALFQLYKVAIGLDSMVVGEDQILGQVKDALDYSIKYKTSKKVLNKVVLSAITFAKKMKSEYRISENPLSIASIAVKFVAEKIGSFDGKNVMIIGMGKFGKLILKYVYASANVYIATRRHHHLDVVTGIKEEFPNAKIIPFDERYEMLEDMDVVFGATASPHLIISSDKVRQLNKPILFMDVAVPRDIDARIKERDGISLYDVDDLKAISKKNADFRADISQKILGKIDREVDMIEEWIEKSSFDETIEKLNGFGDEVYDEIFATVEKNIPLSEKDHYNMQKIIRSCVKKVINKPIKQMKTASANQSVDEIKKTVEFLFDLKGE